MKNNFDLIRLFAASQVIFFNHYAKYFNISILQDTVLTAFAGVPIFFFVSGFLISSSFERNSNLWDYSRNRVLRIFPALWVCSTIAVASVFISGYDIKASLQTLIWYITQLSYPLYTPGFMRDYGVGALNGSLWTIPIELEFYLILPLLYLIFKLKQNNPVYLLLLAILFYLGNTILLYCLGDTDSLWENSLIYKVYITSIFPNLFMFLIGIFFQQNFTFFHKLLQGRFIICVLVYLAFFTILKYSGTTPSLIEGIWQLPLFIVLSMTIFSAAYTKPNLAEKILRKNDISYGVYIYHMPVANFLLYTCGASNITFAAALIATYTLAILSWKFVEYPAMLLKRHQFFQRK